MAMIAVQRHLPCRRKRILVLGRGKRCVDVTSCFKTRNSVRVFWWSSNFRFARDGRWLGVVGRHRGKFMQTPLALSGGCPAMIQEVESFPSSTSWTRLTSSTKNCLPSDIQSGPYQYCNLRTPHHILGDSRSAIRKVARLRSFCVPALPSQGHPRPPLSLIS